MKVSRILATLMVIALAASLSNSPGRALADESGWTGVVSLTTDRATVDANQPNATLTATLSQTLMWPYRVTVYDDLGNRMFGGDYDACNTSCTITVSPGNDQTRTYTAYVAHMSDASYTHPPTTDVRSTSNSVAVTSLGWTGVVSLTTDRATVDANQPNATLSATLSKTLMWPYRVTVYDDLGNRMFGGDYDACNTSCTITVSPGNDQTRTYTAYVAHMSDASYTHPPTTDVRSTSNSVSITNLGWNGLISLNAEGANITPTNPTATLTARLSKTLMWPYKVTVYDDLGNRMFGGDYDACNTSCTITVSPGNDQTRTYTAYVAHMSDASYTHPPTTDVRSTSSVTISGGTVTSETLADLDLTGLALLLAPTSLQEICAEVAVAPGGTHTNGGTLSDEAIACEAEVAAGTTVLKLLRRLALVAGATAAGGVIWWLTHEHARTTPEPSPPGPNPDPAPSPFPQPFPVNDLATTLRLQNPETSLSDGGWRTIAEQCLWATARAGLPGMSQCRKLPIFASGSDVASATDHDIEALGVNPQWVKLNYERGVEKPGRQWKDNKLGCLKEHSDGEQCDEYPLFATEQGGGLASPMPDLKYINAADNVRQGALYGGFGGFVPKCAMKTGQSNAGTNSVGGDAFLGIPLLPSFEIPTLSLCNGKTT